MHRLLPHPILAPALAGIWLLLANSLAPGQIVLGLLLGWAIPFFTLRFWPEAVRIYKPLTLLRFTAMVLLDIVRANFTVARLILGNPQRLRPAFVIVPLELRSELAISLLANTICLTPGTVSALLAPDNKSLLVHALNTTDPDALAATIKQRYETPLKEVFEPC
ncbi:MAG: Na+/H+ antiporter subunit E [Gallionellales bacterium RIFCSPLOWO2_12_FULL_59_22]|nr:MAG: Na+/H+ antiporter subunit E [Gallionellales bacterium RIFCSPLOWO2_02_FULL_59_110]OGT14684.1 MAG: Na+/H+ antiporter subunit E [Gallionellales bacterium RIFCSPLOWO2_12_FULL_59_22]